MSPARLSANRANAQLSTGPTSAAGKAKVCLNALKTGLTGRAVLLPSDDPEHYQALLRDFENQYQPATIREQQLVETICATFWRICRIPTLEAALFAKGRREFVEAFPDEEDLSRRALLIDGEILIKYEKQIRNLGVQDARLHRQYQKLSAELLKIRQERLEREEQQQVESVPSSDLGFEFSTPEIRELVEPLPDATDPVSLPAAGPGENQMEAQAA